MQYIYIYIIIYIYYDIIYIYKYAQPIIETHIILHCVHTMEQ